MAKNRHFVEMTHNTRQHFVPQFYLREWSNAAERVWQYSVSGSEPSQVRVTGVAFERGLYSHPNDDKIEPLATEKELAKVEGLYASVWPGIIDRAQDARTRHNLARFVALMDLRNPKHQETIQGIHTKLREVLKGVDADKLVEFRSEAGTASCPAADIIKGTSEDKNTIKSSFLRSMRDSVQDMADVLVRRRWGVVFSEHPAFVTSDRPVVLSRGACKTRNFGFRTPGTLELRAYVLIRENGYRKHDRFAKLEAAWPSIAPALALFLTGDYPRRQTVCIALQVFLNFQSRWDEWLALCKKAEDRAVASADRQLAGNCAYHAGFIHSLRQQADAVFICAKRAATHWAFAKAGARERAMAIRLSGYGLQLKEGLRCRHHRL